MANETDLRPYYNPDNFDVGYLVIYKPGIGLINPATGASVTRSIHPTVNNSYGGRYNPGANIGLKGLGIHQDTSGFEKDYFNDLEFLEYFDTNNLTAFLKNLFWNFMKNYFKILCLQPLEITRLVLQVGTFEFTKKSKKEKEVPRLLESSTELGAATHDTYDDESDFEIDYFQPTIDHKMPGITSPVKLLDQSITKSPTKSKRLDKKKYKIQPTSKHTVDIMSSIITKDGPNALFRGLNAQFLYQTLSHTIEAWITGFLSPFLGIPDPFFLDLTHLTEPLRSLCLSVLACVLAGVILMPLDLIKVRLMITQFLKPYNSEGENMEASTTNSNLTEDNGGAQSTRSIRESLRNYPVDTLVKPPVTICFLTILHQFSTSIFRKSAPYILFIRYNIDQYLAPTLYTLSNLFLLIMEFFIKLPVENLLRKEQVKFLLQPKSIAEDPLRVVTIDNPDRDLIVEFNDGWKDENSNNNLKTLRDKFLHLGLFNGWRVGVLNIIGFWGYKIVQSGTSVQEERL